MELLLERLEVDVGGARVDGLEEDELHEAHDGGRGGRGRDGGLVHVLLDADGGLGLELLHAGEEVVDGRRVVAVVPGDAVDDLAMAGEDELDLLGEHEDEFVGDDGRRSRGDGEDDARGRRLHGHHAVHARHAALHRAQDLRRDVDAREGHHLRAVVGRHGAQQVVFGDVAAVHDDVADGLAVALMLVGDLVARRVVEKPVDVGHLEDGIDLVAGFVGCHGVVPR